MSKASVWRYRESMVGHSKRTPTGGISPASLFDGPLGNFRYLFQGTLGDWVRDLLDGSLLGRHVGAP